MKILRARDRVAVPWRNGGGLTREVAVHPQGARLEDFGWRVSIATVERSGPFSLFPGIDRHLALFEGSMILELTGYGMARLSRESGPVVFPGDAPANAKILEGPVTDLNVMARHGVFTARLTLREIEDVFVCAPRATTLVFPLSRAELTDGDALDVQDAVMAEPGEEVRFAAPTECYLAEIFATR